MSISKEQLEKQLGVIVSENLLNMEKECPANSQSTLIDLPYSSIDLKKNQ